METTAQGGSPPGFSRTEHERFLTRVLFCAAVVLLVGIPVFAAGARRRTATEPVAHILETHLPPEARGRYALLVVFQPRDCTGYRSFIDAMGSVARKKVGPVVGIPVNAPADARGLREAFEAFAPEFPLAADAAPEVVRVLRALGYNDTPLAIVVDPAGRPVLVVQPQPVPYRQAQVTELIESYMSVLRAGAVTG